MKKLTLLEIFLFSLLVASLQAQAPERTIKLVVSGEASTKDEATKIALRSAIEQAFGTFVSADTEILNDELVKDEIVTISSGNIQSYKEVNSIQNADGTQSVTLETVVSIGKLVNFAKSKGMSTELAGATFAMNMKIRDLNKKNERISLINLFKQLDLMSINTNLYDYELVTSEPYLADNGNYAIDLLVNLRPNINAKIFTETYMKTMKSLSLTEAEEKEYKNANLQFYKTHFGGIPYVSNDKVWMSSYCLRDNYWHENLSRVFFPIEFFFVKSMFNFQIEDNLGNSIELLYTDLSHNEINEYPVLSRMENIYFNAMDENENFSWPGLELTFIAFSKGTTDEFMGFAHNSEWMGEKFNHFITGNNQIKGTDIFKQFKFTIVYPKDSFEKVASINIQPTQDTKFLSKSILKGNAQ